MEFTSSDESMNILILGACGFIGRNLVKYLIDNNLATKIYAVDLKPPISTCMHPSHEEIFENNSIVTFIQADLSKETGINKVFNPSFITSSSLQVIVNCAAETRCGQDKSVYDSRCKDLSTLCVRKAREYCTNHNSSSSCRFIELSTALIYKSQTKTPAIESSPKEPLTLQASSKLEAEAAIIQEATSSSSSSSSPLHLVILRPAYVYGKGDINGLMPRIVCAATYVETKEKMKCLWDAKMRVNTVCVDDVVRAIWHVSNYNFNSSSSSSSSSSRGNGSSASSSSSSAVAIFNLCDSSDSDQGIINAILSEIFHIQTSFVGPILSQVARLCMDDVVESANECHMEPWRDMCARNGIRNTPLSPFMSRELLEHRHVYIDGTAITTQTGFTYSQPRINTQKVREAVTFAIETGIFPPIL